MNGRQKRHTYHLLNLHLLINHRSNSDLLLFAAVLSEKPTAVKHGTSITLQALNRELKQRHGLDSSNRYNVARDQTYGQH